MDSPNDPGSAAPGPMTSHPESPGRSPALRLAALYVGITSALTLVVAASARWLPKHREFPVQYTLQFNGDALFEGWVRWDGGWYWEIAKNGYWFQGVDTQGPAAFFPGYPMAMRGVGYVVGDPALAGVLITLTCGLASVLLLRRWTSDHLGPRVAWVSVVTFMVYPYAWYLFGAVYADALFLCCALGAFMLLERGRPVLAGLVAAVATAVRPVGLALVVGLIAVLVEQRGIVRIAFLESVRDCGGFRAAWRREPASDAPARFSIAPSRVRPRDFGVLLSLGGLLGWMVYLWRTFQNAFIPWQMQGAVGWEQTTGWDTLTKFPWRRDVGNLRVWKSYQAVHWHQITVVVTQTLQASLVLGGVLLIPAMLRRLPWGYAVYVMALLGIAVIFTKDWQGTGRYLLAAFPLYAAAGSWLEARRVFRWVAWILSGSLLVFLTSGYARGYYLA